MTPQFSWVGEGAETETRLFRLVRDWTCEVGVKALDIHTCVNRVTTHVLNQEDKNFMV